MGFGFTDYHSKYFAHELTKTCSSDQLQKLGKTMINATIDLNPHQIDAALFAFRSPLSRGALLADEVGLGKTIEAGLILSQLWAEHKRRILLILPASLRKQWQNELREKFFIDSAIIDSKVFNKSKKEGKNPFENEGQITICSYHFAKNKAADVIKIPWDLVVFDEAHQLRNVFKKTNKIANALRDAFEGSPKLLLTATPLQNSLMELWGLISFIDPHLFGSQDSFKFSYAYRSANIPDSKFAELKERIKPVCQRTLRKQVLEYIKYTDRIPITQDFTPSDEETQLYESVSDYLRRPDAFALPEGQRHLITLVLRKILASSSFAISATLNRLVERLEGLEKDQRQLTSSQLIDDLDTDYETTDEIAEEWNGTEDTVEETQSLSPEELASLRAEIEELKSYRDLAKNIVENSKGNALLHSLDSGFSKMRELGAPRKALIFTESKRTQKYLFDLLSENGYQDQVVTLNGTNTEPPSKEIYARYKETHEDDGKLTGSRAVDMKAALLEEFKENATIMVATESGAEGLNVQFCSLVVNYDLPWNPQRIEQRIGRCHRYGQKFDVVVINFLNRSNAADMRVFELLSEKLSLFEGVFGASDLVLGAVSNELDFERRIFDIYQNCRTNEEIDSGFKQLRLELEDQIEDRMDNTRSKLIEHFDEEVHKRLKDQEADTKVQLGYYEEWLWSLAQAELSSVATFNDNFRFKLHHLPEDYTDNDITLGEYRLVSKRGDEDESLYRIGHPLSLHLINKSINKETPVKELVFDYSTYSQNNLPKAAIKNLVGSSGWLKVMKLSVKALEDEDHIIFSAFNDSGNEINEEIVKKLFSINADVGQVVALPDETIESLGSMYQARQEHLINDITERNYLYFESEIDKLDKWAEDLKKQLEQDLKDLGFKIKELEREARKPNDMQEKIDLQREVASLKKKRNKMRLELFNSQDEVDDQKEELLNRTQDKLNQEAISEELFAIRWRVI